MGWKDIHVTTKNGKYIKGSWNPETGSIWVGNREIGKAKNLEEALAIMSVTAERETHSQTERLEVSDSVGW